MQRFCRWFTSIISLPAFLPPRCSAPSADRPACYAHSRLHCRCCRCLRTLEVRIRCFPACHTCCYTAGGRYLHHLLHQQHFAHTTDFYASLLPAVCILPASVCLCIVTRSLLRHCTACCRTRYLPPARGLGCLEVIHASYMTPLEDFAAVCTTLRLGVLCRLRCLELPFRLRCRTAPYAINFHGTALPFRPTTYLSATMFLYYRLRHLRLPAYVCLPACRRLPTLNTPAAARYSTRTIYWSCAIPPPACCTPGCAHCHCFSCLLLVAARGYTLPVTTRDGSTAAPPPHADTTSPVAVFTGGGLPPPAIIPPLFSFHYRFARATTATTAATAARRAAPDACWVAAPRY